MSHNEKSQVPGIRKPLTSLFLKDPNRFVVGETYRLLLGYDRYQRYLDIKCDKQGELQLNVLEIQELNYPDITFANKQICVRNPNFQKNYRSPKKLVLPLFTPKEIANDIPGVIYDEIF